MIISRVRLPRAAWIAALLVQMPAVGSVTSAVAAQQADRATEDEARAAAIARADAIRDTLTQPPGRRGVTPQDVVRLPFRGLGAAVTALALPPLAVYVVAAALGLDEKGAAVYEELREADVRLGPGLIGSRSWPALVVRYEGLDPLFVEGGASLRGYTLARAGLSFGDTLRGAEVSGTHHRMTQLHTWSLGMDARYADRSDYAHTRLVAGADAWTPVAPHVRMSVGGAWEEDRIGRGHDDARTDLQDAPFRDALVGTAGETAYWRAGGALDLDWTEVRALQLVGFRGQGRYDVFRGAGDTDSDFHRMGGDARLYLPFTGRHLLALRGMAEDHFAEGGEGVPFHRLAMLGDDDGLRGYSSRRFRDRALLAAMVEWRYEVWFHPGDSPWKVEGFAFVDHGGVGPSLDRVDAFETTPGIGLRFIDRGLSLVEVYAAWGGDRSPRFDIELGATF